jgi:hypothetical protein
VGGAQIHQERRRPKVERRDDCTKAIESIAPNFCRVFREIGMYLNTAFGIQAALVHNKFWIHQGKSVRDDVSTQEFNQRGSFGVRTAAGVVGNNASPLPYLAEVHVVEAKSIRQFTNCIEVFGRRDHPPGKPIAEERGGDTQFAGNLLFQQR